MSFVSHSVSMIMSRHFYRVILSSLIVGIIGEYLHGIKDLGLLVIIYKNWPGISDIVFLTRNAIKKTRIYRHGISKFKKFSPSSFNTNYWGEGIKIWKNPYMGTWGEVVGRCPCRDDNFFWKLYPGLFVKGFLLKFFTTVFLGPNLWNFIFFEN